MSHADPLLQAKIDELAAENALLKQACERMFASLNITWCQEAGRLQGEIKKLEVMCADESIRRKSISADLASTAAKVASYCEWRYLTSFAAAEGRAGLSYYAEALGLH